MLEAVSSGIPRGVILDQAIFDQVFALFGDLLESFVVEMKFSFYYVLDNFRFSSAWERHFSRKHDVENHTH